MKFIGAIKPPCGTKCDLRGTEVCHTDNCPYGWKEYQEKVKKARDNRTDDRKRRYLE